MSNLHSEILITNYRQANLDRKEQIRQYLLKQSLNSLIESYYYDLNSGSNFEILEQLIAKLQLTNFSTYYHILLNAHLLKMRDWTLILKSLEELPEKQIIIIQTDFLQFLPETILSRLPINFIEKSSDSESSVQNPVQKIEQLINQRANKISLGELRVLLSMLNKITLHLTRLPLKSIELELDLCI